MISIVIPAFNERESVSKLHSELVSVFTALGKPYEIIFVDDGSTDGTTDVLRGLKPAKVIVFARNFGKSQALQAGFRAASGDYIFTMDADLQDDPKEIPNFIKVLEDGNYDLVCGWKRNRIDSFTKKIVSKIANGMTRFFTGTTVHDMNCGYKLYRKEVAQSINLYGDMHRYIPALVSSLGYSIGEIPVNHRDRQFGMSKYGNFRRLSKSFFDFVTLLLVRRFVDRPMHLFGTIGVLFSFIGGVILVYLTYIKIFDNAIIGNRPLLILGVLMVIIGIQLFSSGFLGELLIRQNTNKKIYTVREENDQK